MRFASIQRVAKCDCGSGPRWGAYSVPLNPLAGFNGAALRREGKGGKSREGRGMKREYRGREGGEA